MVAKAKNAKRERVEVRVSAEVKALIERAALLQDCSISEYVVRSTLEAAERDIRDHDIITLTARDSEIFVSELLNPTPPNAALRAAAEEYRRRWGDTDA
jgi:uncharacterized protein (DUF1778 family)